MAFSSSVSTSLEGYKIKEKLSCRCCQVLFFQTKIIGSGRVIKQKNQAISNGWLFTTPVSLESTTISNRLYYMNSI